MWPRNQPEEKGAGGRSLTELRWEGGDLGAGATGSAAAGPALGPFPIDLNVITEVALNTGFRSRFICSVYSKPNAGVLRFVAEKVFIHKAVK